MKFQPDTLEGVNQITRQDSGRIWVGREAYAHSLLVPWVGAVQDWGATQLAELGSSHFERILTLRPEVVIFGSGTRLRFVSPALMQALLARRIGVETMDTPAACRTYNVLVNEHRSVVAALLLEPGG